MRGARYTARRPRCGGDPCLYVHDATGICLLAYVDDTLIKNPPTAAGRAARRDLVAYLQRRFRYDDKGPATEFTGIRIIRSSPHSITVCMDTYSRPDKFPDLRMV